MMCANFLNEKKSLKKSTFRSLLLSNIAQGVKQLEFVGNVVLMLSDFIPHKSMYVKYKTFFFLNRDGDAQ